MRLLSLVLAVGSMAFVVQPQLAPARYPEPAVSPRSWDLDFVFQTPRRIVVEVPGESVPRAFWYMTYVVTNHTGQDRPYLPTFELLAADGQVIRSDLEFSPSIFQAVARRQSRLPLQPALALAGTILQGEDYAKYSVAIWPEPMIEMGSFTIFVSGLSGEAAVVSRHDGSPLLDSNGQAIVLRKTRQLDFTVKGDENFAQNDPVILTGDSWVMR
jgi:hypothetical protein